MSITQKGDEASAAFAFQRQVLNSEEEWCDFYLIKSSYLVEGKGIHEKTPCAVTACRREYLRTAPGSEECLDRLGSPWSANVFGVLPAAGDNDLTKNMESTEESSVCSQVHIDKVQYPSATLLSDTVWKGTNIPTNYSGFVPTSRPTIRAWYHHPDKLFRLGTNIPTNHSGLVPTSRETIRAWYQHPDQLFGLGTTSRPTIRAWYQHPDQLFVLGVRHLWKQVVISIPSVSHANVVLRYRTLSLLARLYTELSRVSSTFYVKSESPGKKEKKNFMNYLVTC
ncbi:hypothetical protein AVEN_205239-1 [Araneus ventricosus]|uniref:Uncharacterized protein n=1 Tax=Araneus ventricosus TaxID=182803 RepID=A0A4Y2IEF8_ARAVE|nr:hypothetical protein AVEN_205239-1 [Araneus ventricosus]